MYKGPKKARGCKRCGIYQKTNKYVGNITSYRLGETF